MELWKKHPIHELLVSSYGRVSRIDGAPKKLSINGSGYLVTSISRKTSIERVHRLVLETFVGLCPEGMECCHNDGCPTNNRIENLRWGTRKDQIDDQKRHGTFSPPPILTGSKNPAYKWDPDKQQEIMDLINKNIHLREISRITGVSRTQLTRIAKQNLPGYKPLPTIGEHNPMYGKNHSDEIKAKISQSNRTKKEVGGQCAK